LGFNNYYSNAKKAMVLQGKAIDINQLYKGRFGEKFRCPHMKIVEILFNLLKIKEFLISFCCGQSTLSSDI